jgi:hypothetical protein
MTREELIKRVALKMDEISSSDDVIVPVGTGDNNPLYTQINNLLNESVNDVLTKAPIYRLHLHIGEVKTHTPVNIFVGTLKPRKAAKIAVPEDFIRLASITDDAFQRPIVDLAISGDDVANMQHNIHLVAKSAKPVAVISNTANGRDITCYSYSTDATPNPSLLYIKRYDNDKDTTAECGLDDYMIDLVTWVCAGRVFSAQGDVNKGKICDENAASLMI